MPFTLLRYVVPVVTRLRYVDFAVYYGFPFVILRLRCCLLFVTAYVVTVVHLRSLLVGWFAFILHVYVVVAFVTPGYVYG